MSRLGGYLAVAIGGVGIFCGTSGALTFIPFRIQDNLSVQESIALTGIAAIAAFLSAVGLYAGWSLLHGRRGARRACLQVAASCVAIVAMFALTMPPESPSPVPGGLGTPVLFGVVAVAYSVESALLLAGHDAHRPRLGAMAPA